LGHNSLRIPPLVMGHEFCGRIEALGPGLKRDQQGQALEIGQKVVVNPLLHCGYCDRCRKGYTQLCDQRKIIGIHRPGGFAQFAVVPQGAVIVVPQHVDSYSISLAEPLACSLRAVRRALENQVLPNTIIFGAGGIGLLSAMVARILGVDQIIIMDTNGERLKMVQSLGFGNTVNPNTEEVSSKVQGFCGNKGVDVVIDAAGFQSTREMAMKLVSPGGTIMNIGLGVDGTLLPINHQIRSEIEILGSFCYTNEDFHNAVDLLIAGKVNASGWTEIRPLSAGAGAFADLVAGRVHAGKIFLDPGR
jgi:threonine dehydrogenase-like Zn-dependent dehydrogenase